MTYLLVGKNGFVAKRFIRHFRAKGIDYFLTSREEKKEGNQYQLKLESSDHVPDEIIKACKNVLFLASISSPDLCRSEKKQAYAVNVEGTIKFIERCVGHGARVLFFSSDTVYGETNAPVNELYSPHPVGEYGEMKYTVEKHFNQNPMIKIVRMSYVMSGNDKFTNYLNACCKAGNDAEIFHPLYRNPIWIDDVIHASVSVFDAWEELNHQCINFGGPALLSRMDIAKIYNQVVNQNLKYFATKPDADFYRARPIRIEMKHDRLNQILGRRPMEIIDAYKHEFSEINSGE